MANERFQQWWHHTKEKLQHTYRLIIMNNETFEEVDSYRLTLLNVYIAGSTVVVLVAVLVVLAIAFTPLRNYMPGYGSGGGERQEVERLYREVKQLEEQLIAQRAYTENFQRILKDSIETEEDLPTASAEIPADTFEPVRVSGEEEQLRQEMELRQIGEQAQKSRTINFSPRDMPLEQMFFSPPVNGEISAGFMPDKKHFGVDILAPRNKAIKAVMDGYIFFSGWTMDTGNTIGIQHANNTITFYKHNSVLLKKSGSYVKAGEAVAIIGNTGTLSDGPHLHFELWHRGQPVDPTEYINF
jgi:murein DD-endopeptidase MepM/ murein hydrolase activator NlpD